MKPLPLPRNDSLTSDERVASGRSRSRRRAAPPVHSSLKALVEKFDAPTDSGNTSAVPNAKGSVLRSLGEVRSSDNDKIEVSRSRSASASRKDGSRSRSASAPRQQKARDADATPNENKTNSSTDVMNVVNQAKLQNDEQPTLDEITPLKKIQRMKSPAPTQTTRPRDPNSSPTKKTPVKLIQTVARAVGTFLSPTRSRDSSISRNLLKSQSSDGQIDLPPLNYKGPTKLHKACYTVSSLEELRPFCNPSSSTHLEMEDENGRNPLHLLGLNRSLVHSLAYEVKTGTRSSSQILPNPGIDPNKVSDLVNFILDLVMPNHIFLLLAKDKNGNIPFQEALIYWIDLVEKSTNDSRKPETVKSKILNGISKYTEPLGKRGIYVPQGKSQENDEEDETDTQYTDVLVDKKERYAMPPTPQMANSDRLNENISDTNNFEQSMMSGIELPLRVAYSLHVTSGLLDVLGELSRRAEQRMNHMNNDGLRVSWIRSQKKNRSRRQLTRQGNDDFGLTGNMASIVDMIEVSFASTHNVIKTLLSIDDDDERENVLDFSIVRRAMLRKESLGTWLSEMLQDDRRGVRQRAIDYLIIMSEILEREKDLFHDSRYTTSMESRLNELYVAVGELDGLIPSMLALEERMVEEAVATPLLTNALDRLIKTPFVSCTLFFDTSLLLLCIFCFRKSVDDYLLQRNGNEKKILHWLYAVNSFAFYLASREFIKAVALSAVAKKRDLFFNTKNLISIVCMVCLITSVLAIRLDMLGEPFCDENTSRILIAVTTGLLWLRLISILTFVNIKMATFVMAIVKISKDIFWFMVILVVIVLCFAQIFFTLLSPTDCSTADGAIDNTLDCQPSEYYLKVYSVLLGDFGLFDREEDFINGGFALLLFIVFTFLIAIVLLNVLIAIIGDSYERILLRSRQLFGRTRVLHLAELVSLQILFAEQTEDVKTCFSAKLSGLVQFWGQLKWTVYGSMLNALSFLVLVLWCVAEAYTFAKSEAVIPSHTERTALTFGTIAANFVVFVIFLFTLTRKRSEKGFIVNCVQNMMLKLLDKSSDDEASLNSADQFDDWTGRVDYLSKEMKRLNEDFSLQTREVVQKSEARTIQQVQDLEMKMQIYQDEIITQVRQLLDGSVGPKMYRESSFSRSEA